MATHEQKHLLQVVGPKRQMTVPEAMMSALRLKPGDFIEFTIADHQIAAARPCKPLPIDSLPDNILEMIQRARQEYAEGKFRSFEDLRTLEAELEQASLTASVKKESVHS